MTTAGASTLPGCGRRSSSEGFPQPSWPLRWARPSCWNSSSCPASRPRGSHRPLRPGGRPRRGAEHDANRRRLGRVTDDTWLGHLLHDAAAHYDVGDPRPARHHRRRALRLPALQARPHRGRRPGRGGADRGKALLPHGRHDGWPGGGHRGPGRPPRRRRRRDPAGPSSSATTATASASSSTASSASATSTSAPSIPRLGKVPNINSASALEDGWPVLIFDVGTSSGRSTPPGRQAPPSAADRPGPRLGPSRGPPRARRGRLDHRAGTGAPAPRKPGLSGRRGR